MILSSVLRLLLTNKKIMDYEVPSLILYDTVVPSVPPHPYWRLVILLVCQQWPHSASQWHQLCPWWGNII